MKVGKKLNLNSPYNCLTNTLWQTKQLNKSKDRQNIQLRTKLYQIAHQRHHQSSSETGIEQLEQRFRTLTQRQKEQANWIKETTANIDERHYELLAESVKKIENRVFTTTKKTLKLEKLIKKNI